MQKEANLL
jgi:sRNA-binding carbon storage regulator CsrA